MTEGITVRAGSLMDAATIVAHRRAMFLDQGHRDPGYRAQGFCDDAVLDAMAARFLPWVRAKMAAGEYLAWLAVSGDAVVAGVGLWLMEWPPHMLGSGPRRGYILNVYTEPEFRRRGLGRRLTETALEWCRANGIDLAVLHASKDGRPLYEGMGFQSGNEMRRKV
jgi:ribosomal protein S18 acetylase RimI-like enzyme